MIRSLTVEDAKGCPVRWAGKVERLKEPVTFAPGLNVLWGANGSGKSTILRLIARLTHC